MQGALVESAASEESAMTAMDSATNNANEMIKKLTLMFNRARQAHITTEIIEISSGAEALKRDDYNVNVTILNMPRNKEQM